MKKKTLSSVSWNVCLLIALIIVTASLISSAKARPTVNLSRATGANAGDTLFAQVWADETAGNQIDRVEWFQDDVSKYVDQPFVQHYYDIQSLAALNIAPSTTVATVTATNRKGESTTKIQPVLFSMRPGNQTGVGGIAIPVDKFALLVPYIGLASTIMVAAVASSAYVKLVKRGEEKQ